MIECEAVAKKWGNSIGIIIPSDIAERQRIRENSKVRFAILDSGAVVAETFGMLKQWKEPTGKILRKLRKESWHV